MQWVKLYQVSQVGVLIRNILQSDNLKRLNLVGFLWKMLLVEVRLIVCMFACACVEFEVYASKNWNVSMYVLYVWNAKV